MRSKPLGHLLRSAVLSTALIAAGAATALADVPGYDFPDEWRAKPAPMQVHVAPPGMKIGVQDNCRMTDAGTPALSATLGRMASNHLASGATSLRSAR